MDNRELHIAGLVAPETLATAKIEEVMKNITEYHNDIQAAVLGEVASRRLKEYLPYIVTLLNSSDPKIQTEAMKTLAHLDPAQLQSFFLRNAASLEELTMERYIDLFGEYPAVVSEELVNECMKRYTSAGNILRERLVDLVSLTPTEAHKQGIQVLFATESNPYVRYKMALLLASSDEGARDLLQSLLELDNPNTIELSNEEIDSVIDLLFTVYNEEEKERLVYMAKYAKKSMIRFSLVKKIVEDKVPGFEHILIQALNDKSSVVVEYAISMLEEYPSVHALEALHNILSSNSLLFVRQKAAFAVASMNTKLSIGSIIE